MSRIEELEDAVLELEAKLHGKRLELNMAKGLRTDAQIDLIKMNACLAKRYELRNKGCYFTAAGEVDRVRELA